MSKIMKKTMLAVLGLLLGACIALPVIFTLAAESDGVKNLPAGLEEGITNELPLNSELDFSGTYIAKEGKKLDTSCEVARPDGSVSATKLLTLDDMGIYRVTLYGYTDGGAYSEYVYEIYAYKNSFSFSDSRSSSAYGEHKNEPGLSGEVITLYEGATATYNKVIDLSGYTSADTVFEWIPVASTVGAGDFDYIEFTFTDLYDESNYFKISGNYHHTYRETYFKAAAKDQVLSGWYAAGGWVHIGNEWGANAGVSFYNTPRYASKPSDDTMKLHYDDAVKSVGVGDTFVIDFDNAQYFSNLWSGFTNGKCILSVECGQYVSEKPAQFMFTEICGEKMEGNPVRDGEEPEITVDCGEYTVDSMPNARVGYAYPVPEATAQDTYNGTLDVSVTVWLNYGNSAASQIGVENGKFTPTRTAIYTLEYMCVDYSGNKAVLTVPVAARADINDIEIKIKEDAPAEWKIGEKFVPRGYEITGGTGNYVLERFIESPDGERLPYDEKDGFIPLKEGVYTVVYAVSDYIGCTGSGKYEFSVGAAGAPVFYDEAELPAYFIAGARYTLPELKAYDYLGGEAKEAEVRIRVVDRNGVAVLEDNIYTPAVAESGDTVTLVYFAVNAQGEGLSSEYVIPVVEVGTPEDLDTAAYFSGTAKAELRDGGKRFVISAVNDGDYAQYILPVISNGFTLEMKTYGAHDTVEGFTLELTDFAAPSVKITARLIKQKTGARLFVNGAEYEVNESVASGAFSFGYNELKKQLRFGDRSYTVQGFDGFSSGKIYVKIVFNGVTGEYPMEIVNMNTQIFNTTIDEIKPKISVLGEYAGIKEKGSVATVYKAVACDMFDPDVTAYVSVTDPSGNVMMSVDGVRLDKVDIGRDYDILLDEFGYYRVSYYAEDWYSNIERNFIYQFIVEDTTPPEIDVSLKDVKAKAGKSVKLPAASLSDNYTATESLKLSVFVVNGNGYIERVKPQNGAYVYTPEDAGEYVIRYYCTDEKGNAALAEVRLIVS